MGLMGVLYDLLLAFVERYDAKRRIPRPLSHPDLTREAGRAPLPHDCHEDVLAYVVRINHCLPDVGLGRSL